MSTDEDVAVSSTSQPRCPNASLDESCRAAIRQRRTEELRWLPVERYLGKSSYTTADARTLARHLMRTGSGAAYEAGIRILEAAGEPDLETILPLHREAMSRHGATCLWHAAPTVSWAGLAAIATSLRSGGLEANRLAERIERTMRER